MPFISELIFYVLCVVAGVVVGWFIHEVQEVIEQRRLLPSRKT